jgi:PAS domain S-box-containing protein
VAVSSRSPELARTPCVQDTFGRAAGLPFLLLPGRIAAPNWPASCWTSLLARACNESRAPNTIHQLMLGDARTMASVAVALPEPTVDQSFRDLVDALDAIVWEGDPERRNAAFVSKRTEELLGYPAHLWHETDFWVRVIHPDDRAQVLARMRAFGNDGGRDTLEYRFVAADGRSVWVRNFWQVICLPDGRRRVRGMAVDITQQREAEEALRNSEERIRKIFAASHDAIFILEADADHILDCNPRACEMLGYSRTELLALTMHRIRKTDPSYQLAIGQSLRTSEGHIREIVCFTSTGRALPCEVSSSMLSLRGGPAIVAIIRDISQRKRLEERRRLLGTVSAELAESLDCDATLRRVAQLLVPGMADACLVDILDPDGTVRRVASAHGRFVRNDQAPPVAAHNPELSENRIVVPIVSRDESLGVLTLLVDGVQRRFGEDDFQFAREVTQRCAHAIENATLYHETQLAVRARDEFLAATSHELRTPLHHIKAFVSSLRLPDVNWDEDTRQDFLAEIEREADRLARLIADLLDLSRVESGGLDPSQRQLRSPTDIIQGGLDRVRGLLDGRRLLVDVDADLPPVNVEVAQFEGVIANLLENAIKYGSRDGTIRVSARTTAGSVDFMVEDDGPGISEEHLESIFDKFFRVHSPQQSAIPGTGLGLAICRAIVRGHGGQIRADNRPEGGARFVITLPIQKPLVT